MDGFSFRRFVLILQEGAWRREIELTPETEQLTFGRGRGCDYRIASRDLHVSRVQATLSRTNTGWALIDGRLGEPSGRGVLLNGERINGACPFGLGDEAILYSGDPSVSLSWVEDERPTEEIQRIPEILDKRLSHIEELLEDLAVKVQAIERNDQRQDHVIRRWLLGLGAACLMLGGSSIAGGNSDGLEKAVDVLLIVAGGSGAAIAVGQSKKAEA